MAGSLSLSLSPSLALSLHAAGNCWLRQARNGRCQVLYKNGLSKEECCKTGRLTTSWTEEDVSDHVLLKWMIFSGGAPNCIPCKGGYFGEPDFKGAARVAWGRPGEAACRLPLSRAFGPAGAVTGSSSSPRSRWILSSPATRGPLLSAHARHLLHAKHGAQPPIFRPPRKGGRGARLPADHLGQGSVRICAFKARVSKQEVKQSAHEQVQSAFPLFLVAESPHIKD